jgi:VWFA-related protein
MRRLFLIGLLAAGSMPAFAAHRVSVAQLEQALSSAVAKHHADSDIARQIGDMELSERLTDPTLDRLVKDLHLLPQATLALQLLADESAVLDPPKEELPATAPPDAEGQQRILSAARGYVVDTIPRLPNFFATRSTIRFDDSAQAVHQGEWPIRAGFHSAGSSSRMVTVRDGHEVADSAQEVSAKSDQSMGLYSFGEFGPVLARTLTDLANGKIEFSHWEASPVGVVAVYHYSVPKVDSHYQVHFCCMVDREFVGQAAGPQNRNRPGYHIGAVNEMKTSGPKAFDVTPAYHGTLAIEPTSGAIVRMTLDAELDPQDPIIRATTVVEYGRVVIGRAAFICPVRSVAISAQPLGPSATGTPTGGPVVSINETTFAEYHRLGSTSRMVADGAEPSGDKPTSSSDSQWTANAPTQSPMDAGENAQPASAASTGSAAPPAESTAAAVPPPAPLPPAEPVVPEMSMSDARGVPESPANAGQQQDTGFALKVTTRLVDVPVVALDKKGKAVSDLKADDFEIYDNGKKLDIRSFTPPASESAIAPVTSAVSRSGDEYSNRAPAVANSGPPASASASSGGTILLIDESHIAWNDFNNARGQMMKFLSTLPAGERIGFYSMNGLGFRVLVEATTDHASVAARLKAFLPSAHSVSQAQEEEQRNRQQFATVHNAADLNSVNGNHTDVSDGNQPVDPQLLTMGSNPARASFIVLAQVARHLAALPGHKNLVWVSSDNVLADWQDQQVGIDKSPKYNESFATRVQEAMNEAHAAVYPFDVSQLEGGGIGADLQHSNVQLDEAAQENAATAASAGGPGSSGGAAASSRDTGTGRISAQMSQDLHPIQGPVREVAAATGGRTIRRAGDLAAALNGVVDDSRGRYQLSFSPQGEADGSYHTITVKLTGRRGVSIRYRTGYLFAKEPATLKDRFQQAVWQPTDTTEIGVKATVAPSGAASLIKVSIAASDLGMEQGGGRWMDKLDIFFIQRDDGGIRAQLDGQSLGLRLKSGTYKNVLAAGIPFEREVEIRPGMASIRVLVVDENSGRMGSVTIPSSTLRAAR